MIRRLLSFVMGLVLVAAGSIPILKITILRGFEFHLLSLGIFLWIVSAFSGLLILINSFKMGMGFDGLQGKLRLLSLVGGLFLVTSSSFLILVSLGILGFPGHFLSLLESVLAAPFLIFGVLLLYGTISSEY